MSSLSSSSAFKSLESLGEWKPIKTVEIGGEETSIRTVSNISYKAVDESSSELQDPKQSLNITFPREFVTPDDTDSTSSFPVLIFVHGGGWSRGGKDNRFYGAPAVCENVAASGCIAVSPAYRLGNYLDFMHDVAAAIRWVKDNIVDLGGDLDKVYLGGHSAGAHIASLLMVRHNDFLAKVGIPLNFFRGLILLSGIYDLFCPMRKSFLDIKNKVFFLAYAIPAFGSDEILRRQASPLLLLRPEKDTTLRGSLASKVLKTSSRKQGEEADETQIDINVSSLPPVLILNAALDMGLQENGKLMADAMSDYTSVKYDIVRWTHHGSICWNQRTFNFIREFMALQ